MKFYNYLNEEESIDKIRADINRLCGPYIKKLKKYNDNKYLFSGRKLGGGNVIKEKLRKDRLPKDTPLEVHKLLDTSFHQNFGIKARSQTLFCVMDHKYAKYYGNAYYIFPIGDYTTIWAVRIDDLFEWLKGELYDFGKRNFHHDILDGPDWAGLSRHDQDLILDMIEDMDIPNYYSSRDYQKLNKFRNEIMLYCKEYIGIKYEFVDNNFINIMDLIDG